MIGKLSRGRTICSWLICFTLLFGGCSEDEPAEDKYYISFMADLTRIVFTDQPVLTASYSQSGSQYNCTIGGGDRTSNITIQILDNGSIAVGAYTDVQIKYQDDHGDVFEQDSGNADATATITAMTATSVRGRFSGTVSTTNSVISITEGEFFVKRTN
jgi:hypothetical protein